MKLPRGQSLHLDARCKSNYGVMGAGILVMLLALPASAQAATSCDNLAKRAFAKTTITSVETVQPDSIKLEGRLEPSGMNVAGRPLINGKNPAFCRIKAVIKPGAQSSVKSEIWLPLNGWNGRFLHIASFGWGGSINTGALLTGVQEGYAVANNDTGHDDAVDGDGGKFALGPRDRMLDYAGRANHEMAEAAKAMIKVFYGKAQSFSYLVGCSLGGLQGLIAAKKYPADYDGIVAGAPPNPIVNFNGAQLWPSYLINQKPARAITQAKLNLVADAMIRHCAGPIGQAQGFIEEPDKCQYDPVAIQCANEEDKDTCLTPDQVDLVRNIYRGPFNPRTGALIMQGPAKGSEGELGMFARKEPMGVAGDMFRYAAFQNPNWDFASFNYDDQFDAAVAKIGPLMHVDADLSAFLGRGGKLLFYIGWNDYHNGSDLAAYFTQVVDHATSPLARNNTRLFQIPGMGHCANGPGCDTFSKIGVIDAWVAQGQAPEQITTVKYQAGAVVRSRPICAWPKVAVYQGQGDVTKAESFACQASQ